MEATNPDPADGSIHEDTGVSLNWTPGDNASQHDVYFGTDENAVDNADVSDTTEIYRGRQGATSYTPPEGIELGQTYYWRIDEYNNDTTISEGSLWSFTINDFLVVDDFESYNDIAPPDPESNRIFDAWIDGYSDPENGSTVGYAIPPYAEQSNVHGGYQSMPFFYDNTDGYSEATLTLTNLRDWTTGGVSTLSIWFKGNSLNSTERMYVAIANYNGPTAVVYYAWPNATQNPYWSQWNINLWVFELQDVNLADVDTISIGFDQGTGGSGKIYFDDIRLYPPPEPEIDVELDGTDNVHAHSFGTLEVGQNLSQEFTVRNEGVAVLVVTQAAGLISPFSIIPVNGSGSTDDWDIPAGGTQTFTVSFSPDSLGDYSETLVLTSNDSDEGSYQIIVQGKASLPPDLTGLDIGGPSPPGDIYMHAPGDYDIEAGGADIWGNSDQFFYAYETVSGDFTATVQVISMEPDTDPWAKAGIMCREDLDPDSVNTMLIRSYQMGTTLQGRLTKGEYSSSKHHDNSYATTAIIWLKLDRKGDVFAGSWAEDVGGAPGTWQDPRWVYSPMPASVYLGLATTSHNDGVAITAEYRQYFFGSLTDFPTLPHFGPFPGPEGGDGYMGIREVIDNGDINNQDNCYDSLKSGTGTIVDYMAPVLNVHDRGNRGHFLDDDVFGVVTENYLPQGSVDDISIVAKGAVEIPTGGNYTFCISNDDGFTLQFPGHDFTSVYGSGWGSTFPEIAPFANGNALRFWGNRGIIADTLGVINLPAGAHPFVLIYHHEGVVEYSGIEFSAAPGVKTQFDEQFRLVGHQSVGTIPVPGLEGDASVEASPSGSWSGGPVDSLQDAIDALAEGAGANSWGYYSSVNFKDPHTEPGPVDGGSFPGDEPFPNDVPLENENNFGVMVWGVLDIPQDGTYQIGYNSDDGAQLRIAGASWDSIVTGSHPAAVIQNDLLVTDTPTARSWTAGELFLTEGLHDFELIMFEHRGGAHLELFGRRGQAPGGWHLLMNGGSGLIEDFDGLQLTHIIYVDDDATAGANNGLSWDDAFIYLQDALNFAEGSGGQVSEIWVAEGIYKPDQGATVVSGDRSATFQLLNGVAVMGGYAGLSTPDPNARDVGLYETVLSGDLNGDDEPNFVSNNENSYSVVTGSGADTTAILEGFTITSGNANGSGVFVEESGGGMYILGGSPTIVDSTFRDNFALQGGGMLINISNPILTNCTFTNNFAVYGGGMYNHTNSNPILTDCTFDGNYAGEFGGAMTNFENSSPTLTNTVFSGNYANYGGGMTNYSSSSPELTNCTFSGNSASSYGGGLYIDGGAVTLVDSIIGGNLASSSGGGLYTTSSGTVTLTNSTVSENSASYGGGLYIDGGAVTLVDSIISSNSASSYGGGLYTTSLGMVTLTNSTVNDNSASVGGGLYVYGSDTVTLANSTVSGNSASYGGGLYIYGSGTTLTNSTVSSNSAFSYGGGLYVSSGTVTLVDSTVSGNSASSGGGLYITSSGMVTLTNSTVSENSASYGGGLYIDGGAVTLVDSIISSNSAYSYGGGLYTTSLGMVTLTNSTVSSNSTSSYGGGLYVSSGTVTLTNSTVSGNSASLGGGFHVAGTATVMLTNSTVSGNSASYSYYFGGGGLYVYGSGATVTLTNSTVSGNSASSYGGGLYIDGGAVSLNNTIVAVNWAGLDGKDVYGVWSGRGNLIGVDPGFIRNPSAGADGTWGTMDDDPGDLHLRSDGFAVNWGRNDLALDGAGNPLVTDRDGNPRVLDGTVDVGAYEYQGGAPPGRELPSLVVRGLSDAVDAYDGIVTLREAILYADLDSTGREITFSESLFAGGRVEIVLGGMELGIWDDLSILGPGSELLAIDAAGQSRVFWIQGSGTDAFIEGLTISGGFTSSSGGGLYIHSGTLTLTNSTVSGNSTSASGSGHSSGGGGLYVSDGTVTLTNSTVSGNSTSTSEFRENTGGGGLYIHSGTLTLTNSTISGNSASESGSYSGGGGLYIYSATVTLTNSTVSGNSASSSWGGGGLYVFSGTVTLTNSTVSGNSASSGGGLYIDGGAVTLTNSTVSGNSASYSSSYYGGGGLYIDGGAVTLTNSTVSGNSASGYSSGGGLYVYGPGMLTLMNSAVSGNSASWSGGGLYVFSSGAKGATVMLMNSTVSGNSASSSGGGLYAYGSDMVTLTNSTVSSNSASSYGGGLYVSSGTVTLNNTIVALSTAYNGPDIFGQVQPISSHNFIGNGSGFTGITDNTNGNLVGWGDPLFVRSPSPGPDSEWGTIDDDPGDLQLQPSSPCINAGDNDLAVDRDGNPLMSDLRGYSRIIEGVVDIGAYENYFFFFIVSTNLTTYSHGDVLTLSFSQPVEPSSFVPQDDVLSFLGPHGEVEILNYTWFGERDLHIHPYLFSCGDYELVLGPDILSVYGKTIDADRDGTPGEELDDRTVLPFQTVPPMIIGHTVAEVPPVNMIQLQFNRAMAADSFDPVDDILAFDGPDGDVVLSGYLWVDEYTLELQADMSRAGQYLLSLSPDITDPYGNPLDQDGDFVTGELPDDRYVVEFQVIPPTIIGHTAAEVPPENMIQLQFNRAMAADSFDPVDDILAFDGPDGSVVLLGYLWVDEYTLELQADISRGGQYLLLLSPDITDLYGNLLDQDNDFILGEIPDDCYIVTFEFLEVYYWSGPVSEDTTWDYGLVVVDGSVTISEGTKLTIEAGVVVKFEDDQSMLDVHGTLDIRGTPDEPVILTSFKDDSERGDTNQDSDSSVPAPGDWQGLRFTFSAFGTLKNAEIRYAYYAVHGAYSGARIELDSCTLRDGQYGVYVYTSYVEVEADNCLIVDNKQNGVFMRASSTGVYRNCTIAENGFASYYPAGIHLGAATLTLENCVVAFNRNGLHHGSSDPGQAIIRHCDFYNPDGQNLIWDTSAPMPQLDQDGNLQEDPLFVDRDSGNYELSAGSPAIDAGYGWSDLPTDILGRSSTCSSVRG